jgi:hypothetical protein
MLARNYTISSLRHYFPKSLTSVKAELNTMPNQWKKNETSEYYLIFSQLGPDHVRCMIL